MSEVSRVTDADPRLASLPLIFTLGLCSAVWVTVGCLSNYQVSLNDFWGSFFLATHGSLRQPTSLTNGFFPVGYTWLLQLLPSSSLLAWAFLVNVCLAVTLLAGVGTLSMSTLGPGWSTCLVGLIALYPLMFRYAMTPGADIGAATFATLGGFLALHGVSVPRTGRMLACPRVVVAGALLGLAALWRYHALVLGVAILLGAGAVRVLAVNQLAMGMGSLGLVYGAQMALNTLAGRGVLETAEHFNVYRLTHGIDWWHLPSNIPTSSLQVILGSPMKFLHAYGAAVWHLLPYALTALVGSVFLPDAHQRRVVKAIAIAMVMYIVIVGVAASQRAALLLVPFAMWCAMLIARAGSAIWRKHTVGVGRRAVMTGVVGLVCTLQLGHWLSVDYGQVKRVLAAARDFRAVEALVIENGGTDARQVFTDSFDLYFRDLEPHMPNRNGGWWQYDLSGYAERYQEAPLGSLDVFLAHCRVQGIGFLVLTPASEHLMTELGQLYHGALTRDEIRALGRSGEWRVFRLATVVLGARR